jgi:SAM-dependent methyltransferase
MYKKAGIKDIKKFYDKKFSENFVENRRFDVSDFYLGIYNINFAKFFWIIRNIKPQSTVLDFGCGSGTLAVLKNKDCTITGIDYSRKALDIAQRVNGYDSVFCGSIFEFNQRKKSFDYIVSLDVLGHIPVKEKDDTIKELKNFLKPNGVMLHGIECFKIDYRKMTQEQLESFIAVDGHVGIEDKMSNINRFKNIFRYVDGEVRFSFEIPADEYIKQAEKYISQIDQDLLNYMKHLSPFDQDLLNYMKHLSPDEKFAFDIANGLVHLNIEKNKLSSRDSSSGFLFLRASDKPLDEPDFEINKKRKESNSILYDKNIFLKGWYDVEKNDKNRIFRWGTNECLLCFQKLNKDLQLKIFSSFPGIKSKNVTIFFINKYTQSLIKKILLFDNKEHTITLKTRNLDKLDLSIFIDTTWKPALYNQHSNDWRHLGIGISKLIFL